MGVPVIASDLGGNPELVSDGQNGLLFESGNAGDLARQIQRMLDDPAFLGACTQSRTNVRSVEEEVSQISELYEEITLWGPVSCGTLCQPM
jgi:glycosyltransferase involved in cell wall biosynthesis